MNITDEQVRVDFERWATAHVEHVPLVRIGEFYLSPDASLMWGAWQAASVAGGDLCGRLQQKCSDWGTYWRAPDAHGVILSQEQALELLRDALGVEVEVKPATARAGVDLRETLVHDLRKLARRAEGYHLWLDPNDGAALLAIIDQQGDSRG